MKYHKSCPSKATNRSQLISFSRLRFLFSPSPRRAPGEGWGRRECMAINLCIRNRGKFDSMIVGFDEVDYCCVGKLEISAYHYSGCAVFGIDLSERVIEE